MSTDSRCKRRCQFQDLLKTTDDVDRQPPQAALPVVVQEL